MPYTSYSGDEDSHSSHLQGRPQSRKVACVSLEVDLTSSLCTLAGVSEHRFLTASHMWSLGLFIRWACHSSEEGDIAW